MNPASFSSNQNEEILHFQDTDAALAEIERILDQMLLLAQISAGSLDVDRAALQKTLERLQRKINRIADALEST